MELLKFNDAPKSARRGKNPAGFIGAGIMVAVMGLSSTLAGTITISGGTVEFGQGVVNTAACDGSITVTPASTYQYETNTFLVNQITLEGIGGVDGGTDGRGCLGQTLELRAYDASGNLLTFQTGAKALTVTLPTVVGLTETSNRYVLKAFDVDSGTLAIGASPVGLLAALTENVSGSSGGVGFSGNTTGNTSKGSFIISSLTLSNAVTRITVESRSPRGGDSEEIAKTTASD